MNGIGKRVFWGRLFNDTVYMKFRVCFTMQRTKTIYFRYVKHHAYFMLFPHFKIYSHHSGPFKLIKTMFFVRFISNMESLSKRDNICKE